MPATDRRSILKFPSRSRGAEEARLTRVALPDHELTVVIPAFNEEKRLPGTLRQLRAYLDRWGVDYRVIVADDGSTDGTPELAAAEGRRYSVIRLPRQRGKGRAVRTAMLAATGSVVAFTDADLPYDLEALRQGHQWIRYGACEVVFGARDLEQSRHLAHRRLSRKLATLVFRELVKRLISREVTDTQCGLKLLSRRAAWEVFSRATIDGFAFDAEIVLLTHLLGLPFRRVPVTLINEYDSTLSLLRHTAPMIAEVVRLWARARRGGYDLSPRLAPRPEEGPHAAEAKKAA
jgi:dolichyl-phosphate beta-glucosyltransferase